MSSRLSLKHGVQSPEVAEHEEGDVQSSVLDIYVRDSWMFKWRHQVGSQHSSLALTCRLGVIVCWHLKLGEQMSSSGENPAGEENGPLECRGESQTTRVILSKLLNLSVPASPSVRWAEV